MIIIKIYNRYYLFSVVDMIASLSKKTEEKLSISPNEANSKQPKN